MSITDKLVNDIEGHLLLAATREKGRTAAARFSAPLHWLTDAQRSEVERRFEAEYLALARASCSTQRRVPGDCGTSTRRPTAACGAVCWPFGC